MSRSSAGELVVRVDRYNGVHIGVVPDEPVEFVGVLGPALAEWRAAGRTAAWLRLERAQAGLLEAALALGFEVHHGRPSHIQLLAWLAPGPCMVPPQPHTAVGVGGFVSREEGGQALVLCVQERQGPRAWKLPGGMVEAGEELGAAAEREVREETGVVARCLGIAAFRHSQSSAWGKCAPPHRSADLYFVCRMEALDWSRLEPQEAEIAAVAWLPLAELLALPYYRGLYHALMQLAAASRAPAFPAIAGHSLPTFPGRPNDTLYTAAPLPTPRL